MINYSREKYNINSEKKEIDYILKVTIKENNCRQTFDLVFLTANKRKKYFQYYSKLKGIISVENVDRYRV